MKGSDVLSIRYSRALIEFLGEEDYLQVESDLQLLINLFNEVTGLEEYLKNPVIDEDDKFRILNNISFSKKETGIFLRLLIQRRRIEIIKDIFIKYQNQLNLKLKRARAVIYSKHKVSEKLKKQLENLVKESTEAENILLTEKEDNTLCAGVILKIEDKVIDMSLKGCIEKYVENVKEEALNG